MLSRATLRRRNWDWGIEPFEQQMLERLGAADSNGADLTAQYPVDILEDDQNLYINAEMPGFEKEEIQVNVAEKTLNISAERKAEKEKTTGKTHLQERRYSRVERSFTLPGSVNGDKVDATLEDGVLRLVFKKRKDAAAQKIAIK